MPEWAIEQLTGNHDHSGFDCGKQSLSEWIQRYAGQNDKRDTSRTYVAVRPVDFRVFGYYSLSSYQIRFEDMPAPIANRLPRKQPIPAALIGKLAVDKNAQGQGLGEILLMSALGRAVLLSQQIAINAVVVDAIDEQAKGFYLKYGFRALLDDPLHLFIPLSVVRQLNLNTQAE
ncbi:Acetyltransferase (GNAT) domain-containing protein [Singulisphaera sp. GP187]|uniref:GNAT family N-acetyltransferase n=1 Tax=Singulisphaera sp. GP187 TaxID=1882752 RepID=UPI000927D15A|nr:GNAT family N-acetyltransferase [Singulisphaera sp. GP187]SIO60898.1 Acetyltransferase (GNAT) domain-containing protein [Singulisphaera sp. GP187]